jgi:hypothetical protein
MAKYTSIAPIAIKRASNPNATGKFNVITGIRLPRFICAGLDGLLELLKSLPQTRQRAASSLTRVPHVGHSFVGFDGVSGFISSYRQPILRGNWAGLGGLYQKNLKSSPTCVWYTRLHG